MTVVETMSSATSSDASVTAATTATSSTLNPVVLKTSQEILTSLHLIKDIRRLEKYQRDFFLKVKESLNHVQVLLDHQLMDMAWSDNLTDCEENLLKVSTHLQTTSASQLAELYSILIHDREKLSARFQELSVKSSLSEFVVNSRALLDLHGVQIAAEAILKNEKPLPARGDHSIPVDHTFFLANFCTASLASSMMATFIPKASTTTSTSSYSPQQRSTSSSAVASASAYETKKLNGNLQQQQQANGGGHEVEHLRSKNGGRTISQSDYGSGVTLPPASSPRTPVTSNAMHNAYEEKYLVAANASSNTSNAEKGDLSNGIYGHELVSAISQITQHRRDDSSATSASANKTPTGKLRIDPWGGKVDDSSSSLPSLQGERYGRVNSGGGNNSSRYATSAALPPSSSHGGHPQDPSLNQNDALSDDMSSTSEDAVVADVSGSPMPTERGKPLSFARIASLNLEKQQQAASSKANSKQNSSSLPTLQAAIDHRSLMAATPPSQHTEMLGPIVSLPPSSNPRYFFDIVMEGRRMGRVIIEVDSAMAPKMAMNFHSLATGERGFGYRGCQFFQVWKNESVICGDWEHNSGRGGRAALDDGPLFTPDETKLPCIRGAVGMRRMSKKHSTLNEVASQFRIILTNMTNQFTGIFGHIVSNIEVIDRVANFGGEGGRPEKMAIVANCGIYK